MTTKIIKMPAPERQILKYLSPFFRGSGPKLAPAGAFF
jgi:hypothetical protein